VIVVGAGASGLAAARGMLLTAQATGRAERAWLCDVLGD
jgi:cation diffusion facilitator CzcD-associated flavoprotein CzcO